MDLNDLFTKYGTDKNLWGYHPHYMRHLEPVRMQVKRVLEIGICGNRDIPNNVTGASLFAWRDFFPNAEIVGVDNEKAWMVNTDRIQSYCINAYDPNAMKAVALATGPFDFICDDAVHDPIPQIDLLRTLLPYLTPDGLYSIEDVCPYKLPNGDMQQMIQHFPGELKVEVNRTIKPEVLILIKRSLGISL